MSSKAGRRAAVTTSEEEEELKRARSGRKSGSRRGKSKKLKGGNGFARLGDRLREAGTAGRLGKIAIAAIALIAMVTFMSGSAVEADGRALAALAPEDGEAAAATGAAGGEGGEGDDDIPEMVGFEAKKSNKINRAKEKEMACKEVECEVSCNKKINPKCAATKKCKTDREKICKRRCLKARCEERCKDEPKYGYVEREQKMDKCKEGCQGSTAAHNKCIKKCHSEFKPCKSRCHEISAKFTCDTKKVEDLMISEEEEEEEPAPKVAAPALKGAAAAADTDFDDEVI